MAIVSVILPNHNYSDFIADAIRSVKEQTLKDFECIIVDDASTDNSVPVIRDLIKGDDRFKLITLDEPVGVSAARNIALDIATGEYVSFLDSDDCYAEFALEMLVELARTANAEVAGGTAEFVNGHFQWAKTDGRWNINNWRMENDFTKMLLNPSEQKWVWIWRRIYKRELLNDVRFPPEMKINGDDIAFMLDIVWRIKGIAETKNAVVYHRIHPLSITSNHTDINPERIGIFPKIFARIRETLIDKYDDDFLRALYKDLFSYMVKECLFKNKNLSKDESDCAHDVLKQSCRLIPLKYLPFKFRLLCRYLRWK